MQNFLVAGEAMEEYKKFGRGVAIVKTDSQAPLT